VNHKFTIPTYKKRYTLSFPPLLLSTSVLSPGHLCPFHLFSSLHCHNLFLIRVLSPHLPLLSTLGLSLLAATSWHISHITLFFESRGGSMLKLLVLPTNYFKDNGRLVLILSLLWWIPFRSTSKGHVIEVQREHDISNEKPIKRCVCVWSLSFIACNVIWKVY
jgi:hypothetical protein